MSLTPDKKYDMHKHAYHRLFNVIKTFLFLSYCSVLVYIVFFASRRHAVYWGLEVYSLVPVRKIIHSYYLLKDVGYWNFYSNLLGNIVLFVPIPFFMTAIFNISNRALIIITGFTLSVGIELAQYHWRVGIPDVDDVILNTIGVIAGVCLRPWVLKMMHLKNGL